ncbi:hypothetical protein V6N13_020964 [Hibiscus sabdariffa]
MEVPKELIVLQQLQELKMQGSHFASFRPAERSCKIVRQGTRTRVRGSVLQLIVGGESDAEFFGVNGNASKGQIMKIGATTLSLSFFEYPRLLHIGEDKSSRPKSIVILVESFGWRIVNSVWAYDMVKALASTTKSIMAQHCKFSDSKGAKKIGARLLNEDARVDKFSGEHLLDRVLKHSVGLEDCDMYRGSFVAIDNCIARFKWGEPLYAEVMKPVHETRGPSTSAVPGFAAQGPSTEPYTPSPMAPPTEGFFVGAFQPYSSMMTAPHQLHTSVAPLSVYPPHRPDFGYSYGMVQHTPPGSLFATGPSGSDHDVHDDVEADESEEDENDEDALV